MPLKELFLNFRDKYMTNQVNQMDFPEFGLDEEKRYQIIFSGIVQGVGFRYEMCMIAGRLGLTGFCKNLSNGDVLSEVQGPKNKVEHLIRLMESIRRIHIKNKEITELPLKDEKEFTLVYSRE